MADACMLLTTLDSAEDVAAMLEGAAVGRMDALDSDMAGTAIVSCIRAFTMAALVRRKQQVQYIIPLPN